MQLEINSRAIKFANSTMEYGIYFYVFTTFLYNALWQLALTAVLLVWIVKHSVTKGRYLGYARHPLVVYGLVFGLLLLISTFYAADTMHGLNIYRDTIGATVILLLTVADVFNDEKKRKRLLWVLALTGLFVGLVQVGRYAIDFLSDDGIKNFAYYRQMSDPLTFFIPFTLAIYCYLTSSRSVIFWGAVIILQSILLLATGARGAWLGIMIGISLWWLLRPERKLVRLFLVLAVVDIAVLAIFPRENLVVKRMEAGMESTTVRIEARWGPTYEMILSKPLMGYGFGDFYGDLVRQAKNNPWLTVERPGPYGPHNNYLEIWFSAGIAALGCLILMFARMFRQLMEYVLERPTAPDVYLGLAALTVFAALYLVRGFFEDIHWRPFGLLLGISIVLLLSKPRISRGPDTFNLTWKGVVSKLTRTNQSELMGNRSLEKASFLIIRAANIGDLVCTTPLIHALRERYPKARLCVLVNSYNQPVVENNPDIDEVYAYMKAKHRGPGQSVLGVYWNRLRLMRELRRQRFDYAIIGGAHFLPRALRLARAIKPKHIIGFIESGKRGVNHIDIGVPYTLPHPMHEAQDIFRLLEPLGITGEPPRMRVYPDAVEVEAAQYRLERQRAPVGQMLIGVQLSSRKPANRWPVENFIKLIRRLHAAYNAAFLLLWSPGRSDNPRHPGDDDAAAAITAALTDLSVVADPQGPLPQLIADLSLCDLVITSDGGALHIAAALGKPTLCFFGSTDAARWRPWGVPHILLQPVSRQAADISVDEAFHGFESLLVACGQTPDHRRPNGAAQGVP